MSSARRLILASASPRRADLLRSLGLSFAIEAADLDETQRPGEDPVAMALRLARAKAEAPRNLPSPALVVAADTIVVIDGAILGKPVDRHEARRMLGLLAGRTHEVITALAVRPVPEESLTAETRTSRVRFRAMTAEEIAWYAATGEGDDKAGAYALQGKGSLFIDAIEGSYTNVIGLPLDALHAHLRRWGFLRPPA